jgi:dTMP kinase
LREVLLQADGIPVAPPAEVLLFAAARAQLVAEVIRPALDAGRWVLCDRFVDSSLAYQGLGRGLGVDAVWDANRVALAGCVPDRALVLDVPVGAARGRAAGEDRIETEGDGFQQAVAAGYRELARRFPERVVLVPASGPVDEVHAAVMARVEDLL